MNHPLPHVEREVFPNMARRHPRVAASFFQKLE
jgi:hypothetical protein